MTKTAKQWVSLYSADVRANPGDYKLSVSANPEASAMQLIEGLDEGEVKQLIAYLKAETKALS